MKKATTMDLFNKKSGTPDADDGLALESRPRVKEVSLQRETEKRYLNYALSVITSRALPDVRDGLKPVQRRILYGMYQNLKLLPTAKYRKSAAVVGEVMGKYHPHGDQAIYDAMVRMAQPFSLQAPLVEGYGNFGSVDGDKAAAMRYTEVRLQPISLEMLDEIKQETVPFRDTFDGTMQEPVVLPSRFPNLLLNGSSGIAVGMATNIPPHHLGEIMDGLLLVLDNPEVSTPQLLRKIKGPDFPTGGTIITPRSERIKIYESGGGSIQIRGEWREEKQKKRQKTKQLIITSIPYTVNKTSLIEKIADEIVSKKIPPLLDIRDESTEKMRIVLEVKSNCDPEMVMAYLYKHTPLQQRFAVNLTCLVPTPNPQVSAPAKLSLKQILEQFLAFRFEVLEKRFRCELRKLKKRIHILEGFRKLFDDLDEAIRIIRHSDGRKDAAVKLMKRFQLDQEQVDAILDTRLYRLARLEIQSIRDELKKLRARAEDIEAILESREKMTAVLRDECQKLRDNYQEPRRTRIRENDKTPQITADSFIQQEDTHVILTKEGWVKRIRTINDLKTIRVREGDSIIEVLPGSTKETVSFFTNMGIAYTSRIWDIPATTGYGVPLQSLFKFGDGEKVIRAFSMDYRMTGNIGVVEKPDDTVPQEKGKKKAAEVSTVPPNHLLIVTQNGLGSRLSLAPYREISTKNGRRFTRLTKGDTVQDVRLIDATEIAILISQSNRSLFFPVAEINFLSSAGKGVQLMKLDTGEQLFAFDLSTSEEEGIILETHAGEEYLLAPTSKDIGKRNARGTRKRVAKEWSRVKEKPLKIRSLKNGGNGKTQKETATEEVAPVVSAQTTGDVKFVSAPPN